jgi:hypothetical protein
MEKFKSILILIFVVGLSLVEVTAGEYSFFYVIRLGVVSPVDFDEVKLGERVWPDRCFVVLLETASRSDSQLPATSPHSFVTVNLLLQITGVNLTPLRTLLVKLLPTRRVRVTCLRVYFTYFNPLLPNAMQNFKLFFSNITPSCLLTLHPLYSQLYRQHVHPAGQYPYIY